MSLPELHKRKGSSVGFAEKSVDEFDEHKFRLNVITADLLCQANIELNLPGNYHRNIFHHMKHPHFVFKYCGVPSAAMEPWHMRPVRVQSTSHSSILCDVSSIARPLSSTALSKSRT